jgi:hypothetical protein
MRLSDWPAMPLVGPISGLYANGLYLGFETVYPGVRTASPRTSRASSPARGGFSNCQG